MIVWIFVVTMLFTSGKIVAEYGPYPSETDCRRVWELVTLQGLPVSWSKTACQQVFRAVP